MNNSEPSQHGSNSTTTNSEGTSNPGQLRKAAEAALSMAREARQEVAAIREERDAEIAELEDEIHDLREEIKELRSATRLLDHVASAGQLDSETRAAICIQTAYNDALDADDDMAFLTAREAWSALGRSVDRTRMYDVFRKAESLYAEVAGVDPDDVGPGHPIYFKKEERGHQPPSRLVVDLSNGGIDDLNLPRTEVLGR